MLILEFAILVRVVKPSNTLCAEIKLAEVCTLMWKECQKWLSQESFKQGKIQPQLGD